MVQWLGGHLPMQGDMGSRPGPEWFHMPQATESMSNNYWAHAPQLLKPEHPWACALQQEKPLQWEAHAPHLESSS